MSEANTHARLISLATQEIVNSVNPSSPFILTAKAKKYLDRAADEALAGNDDKAYNFSVIGAHLFVAASKIRANLYSVQGGLEQ